LGRIIKTQSKKTRKLKEYELIVIGSGPSGEKAAVKAAYFGHSVALIEKSPKFGGAGVQTGTLPSKTLKETALYFSRVYEKGIYSMDPDFSRETGIKDFLYRKNLVTDEFGIEVKENILRHKVDLIEGKAEFTDPHTLKIHGSNELIRGKNIIIATGSYPVHPDFIPEIDGERLHDSDTILEIDHFPRSICILGAGVIGCEYATIFASMGVKVHIVNNRDKILGFLDEEVSAELVSQMKKIGIDIHFNTSISEFEVPDNHDLPLTLLLEDGNELNVKGRS
jgi:NAD(P) transhydrogenase